MIPEYPKFKPIEIEDRSEVLEHLVGYDISPCELAFSNQYMWKDLDRTKLTTINGNLCILIDALNEEPFFLEPVGGNDVVDTTKVMLEHTGCISRVSKTFIKDLSKGLRVLPLRDHFDYLYRVRDLAALRGRKYDGKRNHINRFMREHVGWKFDPLRQGDGKDVLNLFERWCELKRSPSSVSGFAYEMQRQALINAMDNYDELGLIGGAVWVGGELLGFIIGGRLNDETICVHFNYCYQHKSGIATVLLREACRTIFSEFTYANLEQDLGMLGLRKNKESYYPLRMVEKYTIR